MNHFANIDLAALLPLKVIIWNFGPTSRVSVRSGPVLSSREVQSPGNDWAACETLRAVVGPEHAERVAVRNRSI